MKRKIAIIIWDLSQIGGIATRGMETKKLLDKNGIDNDIIILTNKDRAFKIDEQKIEATKKSFNIKGIELSVKPKNIRKTMDFLKKYDTFFHLTACIHDNTSMWLAIYMMKKKQYVVISDVYWNDFYPYFDEAIPYVTKFYATNCAVKNYLEKEKGISSELLVHPFNYEINHEELRENTVVWANQWRGWKGIKLFVKIAKDINGKLRMFGSGREYYNLRDDFSSNIIYEGFKDPSEIIEAYKHSKLAVDLTGQSPKYYGHHNRTTIEPMFYGCVVVCNEKLVAPYSHIPENTVCSVNKHNVTEKINELLENEEKRREIAKNALNWAIEHYSDYNILKQIL